MAEVGAVIIAVGDPRRTGGRNGLLSRVAGRPMIRHVVLQYRAALDGPITVVTGHDAVRVQAALEGIDLACVFNPDHRADRQSSVAFGLAHSPEADLLLIGLGDQPLLRAADLRDLVGAHLAQAAPRILIPARGVERGTPIAVPKALRTRLIEDPARFGCIGFTRHRSDLVAGHPLDAPGFYADVDTPMDNARLAQPPGLMC